MNPWITRSLAGVAGLIGLAAATVLFGAWRADVHAQRQIEQPPYPLALPTGGEAVARGQYLYAARGCADCHGADGAGRVFVDAGDLHLAGPHIAPGPGSVTAAYRPADWERVLRHGIKPDARPVRVMPSQDYARLSDEDLGALVAYVRQLPPVKGGPAEIRLPLIARVMYGLGRLPDAVDLIDHQLPPSPAVPPAVSVAYGAYVAQSCVGCHGTQLQGGRIPGSPPDWPASPALRGVEHTALEAYPTPEALRAMFASGRRADGSAIQVMPFEMLRAMDDTDLRALHLYLSQGSPVATAAAAE